MKIEILGRSAPHCPFCEAAKSFCERFGKEFTYSDMSKGEWDPAQMAERLGHPVRTVPVVFVDDKFIGGAAELGDLLRK